MIQSKKVQKTRIKLTVIHIDNDGYHLMLKAKINGKTATFILDTGASKTVMDINKINRFIKEPIPELSEKSSTGLGTNSMQSYTAVLKKFELGELKLKDYMSIFIDLSHVNSAYSQIGIKEIDGVLGNDILMKYKAVIDYKKKELKLWKP